MPEQPGDHPPQRKRKVPLHQNKGWLSSAYCVARDDIVQIPLAECTPVSWDVGCIDRVV